MTKIQMTKTYQGYRINRIFFIGCPCQGLVLNFGHLNFGFVSDFTSRDFVLRIFHFLNGNGFQQGSHFVIDIDIAVIKK